LKGGNRLSLEYRIPARGDIYDRRGKALTAQADAVALGVEPAKLKEDQTEELLSVLSTLLRRPPEEIRAAYTGSGAEYVPLGEALAQDVNSQYQRLSAISGLVMTPYRGRYYFDGGVAPHVTGYVLSISPEELEDYQRRGYSGDEKVGAAGLEAWGEDFLTGKRGASVYVVSPENKIVTRMAETNAQAARYLYTTLEKDLQFQAQKALEGFTGAIVVLERDSGRILALVSSPGYDPNLFEPTNRNNFQLSAVLNNEGQPLLNRATQGVYPLGSVSKIVTMAAALESTDFTPFSTYNCGYEFTELGSGQVLYDWTYTAGIMPSGVLTLPEGLMLSCNPWFWHIGLTLFQSGKGQQLSDMAHGFGLGSPTGIQQLPEASGSFPEPQDEGDAVQMSIGQGSMLVTPLQVAAFVAAVGNGGTLYQPQIIEKVASPDGDAETSFEPIVTRRLPVSAENLLTIQDAMRSVVEDRRGTARNTFTGLQIPVYGKTGTAQNAGDLPHAWFAGYTDAARPDRPDIAIAVLAENAGEGSMVAAPIFRRVVEIYFSGKPIKLYPWESSFYVVPDTLPGLSPNLPSNQAATETPTP
jgi:penicillin-binding protein 2